MRTPIVVGFMLAGCSHHVSSHSEDAPSESKWDRALGAPEYDRAFVDAGAQLAPNPDPTPTDMVALEDFMTDLGTEPDLANPCEISSASGRAVPGLNC